tara:strand:+ start:21 stop:263 length:243 start_codon:yes stop_codon:yes gene_type:complete
MCYTTEGLSRNKKSNKLYTLLFAVRDKYRQLFISIDIEEAQKRGFRFVTNIYGDRINQLNCRSLWIDNKNRTWRVEQLNM